MKLPKYSKALTLNIKEVASMSYTDDSASKRPNKKKLLA